MPSKVVANVYNDLIGPEHRVTRGSIGVEFQAQANPAVARVYGVKSGVTVSNVTPGGPADQAGIRTGDTLVSVNSSPVKNGDELVDKISHLAPGQKAKLGYIRNGKEDEATVTIANRAKLYAGRLGDDDSESDTTQPPESKLGVTVKNITPDIADRLGVDPGKGVMVQDVKPGSFADEDAQLSKGDVILEVNRKPVNSEDDFRKAVAGLKSGDDVVFLVHVRRNPSGSTNFLGGTIP